jgi:mono/diheme cytochrome c family protein
MLGFLSGCQHATTPGNEAPDEVFIVGTPTWSNGVAQLIGLKCAVCHQQPLPDIAPNNTPRDLDLRQFTSAGTLRGAQDTVAALQAKILRHDLVFQGGQSRFAQMPLDFATPLTANETAALETWASPAAEPDVGGGTTPADGLILYAAYCQSCHGVAGNGGLATAIRGTVTADTLSSIQIGITSDPDMQAWPGLSLLNLSQQTAIANYLTTP